jgi:hypothetical protein
MGAEFPAAGHDLHHGTRPLEILGVNEVEERPTSDPN